MSYSLPQIKQFVTEIDGPQTDGWYVVARGAEVPAHLPHVDVWQKDNGNYAAVVVDVQVTADGNVRIRFDVGTSADYLVTVTGAPALQPAAP